MASSGDGRDALDAGLETGGGGPTGDPPTQPPPGGAEPPPAPTAEELAGAKRVCSSLVSQIITMFPNHLASSRGDSSLALTPAEYDQGMILGNATLDAWLPEIGKYSKGVVTVAFVVWCLATTLPRISRARVRPKSAKASKETGPDKPPPGARDPLDAGGD